MSCALRATALGHCSSCRGSCALWSGLLDTNSRIIVQQPDTPKAPSTPGMTSGLRILKDGDGSRFDTKA